MPELRIYREKMMGMRRSPSDGTSTELISDDVACIYFHTSERLATWKQTMQDSKVPKVQHINKRRHKTSHVNIRDLHYIR